MKKFKKIDFFHIEACYSDLASLLSEAMLEKYYNAADSEIKLYQEWEDNHYFSPINNDKPSYTIVIPPPNITGNLHIGHALNTCLQDILIRYHRMAGYNCLWLPGTDHAGIATQILVEKQLGAEGITRHELGREAFIAKIWEWKNHSGGNILRQFRRLGASVDWSRERFTMDQGLSDAVLEVFVSLYHDGLIYKDTRLVNWDPVLETAISDLEVQSRETYGNLWYLDYPLETDEGSITIATTRPETMFADVAIAVHPDDVRYQHLHGKHAILPYCERLLPIIADEMADPQQGSGAVKISPAHDFNDFTFAKKHNLSLVKIFDEKAHLVSPAPNAYIGMERFAARKKLLIALKTDKILSKSEEYIHQVPFGERSNQAVEPMLTKQWFVDAKALSQAAIDVVKSGETQIFPENWTRTYFDWLENIQPWCISRQLWWGHQIPAWYGEDDQVFVARTEAEALAEAEKYYGKKTPLRRDPDVLDTWFSSALWAFSPFGWPEKTDDLQRFFPTSVLITGFDIIFFWVARMMMITLYFTKQIPFKTVYVHALVRDASGQKMSKSKGNVIDPMDLIAKYGCDAMRFTLAALAAPGRDLKLSDDRIESSRNFTTKIWNAARFLQIRQAFYTDDFHPTSLQDPMNRWMLHEISSLADETAILITQYRFHDAANQLYQFVWGIFCDWYLEFSKNISQEFLAENTACLGYCFEKILHLLHPFMPFITSELYRQGGFSSKENDVLMLQSWPKLHFSDQAACHEINKLMRLITQIRSIRSQLNLPAGSILPLSLANFNAESSDYLHRHHQQIEKLARVTLTLQTNSSDFPKGAVRILHDEIEVALLIADVIDMQVEIKRLSDNIAHVDQQLGSLNVQLKNPEFLAKAPAKVVAMRTENLKNLSDNKVQLQNALDILQKINEY